MSAHEGRSIADYPAHWWAAVQDSQKPEWEILPQESKFPEVILSKRNELGLLSNFAITPFEFRGRRYKSIEGFWQMMFYPESEQDERAKFEGLDWKYTRDQVAELESHEAFTAGVAGFENMRAMGINYVTFEGEKYEYWTSKKGEHYDLIVAAMQAKLAQNPKVAEVLRATKGLVLRADHREPADAPPSWGYYKIWMELRDKRF